MMLVVAEEVFSSRENEPLSIADLIEEMKARGVHFTAKDPAKSLAQAMKNSGRFETARRGMYRVKKP
jgi:DNA phosphorothioation-dependent restriction protein DptG